MTKKYVVGVDEVGRGPLAGPITVGAVLKRGRVSLRRIKDSKKLSAKQREEWIQKINSQNLKVKKIEVAVASVGPQVIDRVGITRAATLAVGRCLQKLKIANCEFKILLDGSLYAPRTYVNQKTIIKGDEKISLIAAASIFAKVHRDKKMACLSRKFPEYGLDIHKGYGTRLHCSNIKKYGLSPIHRKGFCKKFV